MDARGRVLGRAHGLGHGRRAARSARRPFAPGRLDDRYLEPGPRPASGHERPREPARRGSPARRSAACRRDQRRCGRRRRRRHAQRTGALRPAAAQACASSPPRCAGAHLLAAGAWRFRKCVRDRIVHGRARRDRRRGSGRLPALTDVRSARATGDRDGRRDGRLVRHARARWSRARLRLCPLQEPRRLCGGRGRGRGRRTRFVSPASGPPSMPAW